MERLCVLLLVLGFPEATVASAIIFPGQLDYAEGDACPTRSGGTGNCSRSCTHSASLGEHPRCGIKDSAFLFCCDKTLRGDPAPLTDIAPPKVSFQCGKNAKNSYFLFGVSVGEVLRPEAATPTNAGNAELTRPARSIPDEILPERLENPQSFTAELEPTEKYPKSPAIGAIPSERNAWPWMALIGEENAQGIRWFCGGVLISEQWVLSALHCFLFNTADVVRLGEHNYNNDYDLAAHQDFSVAETVHYPDYHPRKGYHDLALLRLKPRVTIEEFISPVCLPWGAESHKDITAQKATLTGWGDTEFGGSPSSILQEVNVTVFPSARCDRSYSLLPHYQDTWPEGIGPETLCAGDPNGGRDACQGDSGGPLVSQDASGRFVLAGIVSQGYGCGHKDYPGLYVNVRHPPYLAWIKKVAFTTP